MNRFENLYVVLKIAEVCNLGCTYCYFFSGGDDSYTQDPRYITVATVEEVARFLAHSVDELDISTVHISFHGGEPLMVGKRRMLEYCKRLHRHISPKADLRLSLQTNATLLDK